LLIIDQLIFIKYLLPTAQNHNCNLIDNELEQLHVFFKNAISKVEHNFQELFTALKDTRC